MEDSNFQRPIPKKPVNPDPQEPSAQNQESPKKKGQRMNLVAHDDHEKGHGQDTHPGRPAECPPGDFCEPRRIVDQVEGNDREEAADEQSPQPMSGYPFLQGLRFSFRQHPAHKRLPVLPSQKEGQKGSQHGADPGDNRPPGRAEDHSVGDGYDLRREGDKGMKDHHADCGQDPPVAPGFDEIHDPGHGEPEPPGAPGGVLDETAEQAGKEQADQSKSSSGKEE